MTGRMRICIEVCSGPDDGETFRTELTPFSIGTLERSSLRLSDEEVPAMALFDVSEDGSGEVLACDEPFLHDGGSQTEIGFERLPAIIRFGWTDIYVEAESTEDEIEPADDDEAEAEDLLKSAEDLGLDLSGLVEREAGDACSHCGLVNQPDSDWCSRCGWDLNR